MKIPAQDHHLATPIVLGAADIDSQATQAHVVKHPFGMGAMLQGASNTRRRPWNAEGWDTLEPPVLTLAERRDSVGRIQQLEVGGARCLVSRLHLEEYAGDCPAVAEPCYECAPSLVGTCAGVTAEVAERYAAWVDAIVGLVSGDVGIEVRPPEVHERVVKLVRSPARFHGLVIASLGCELHGNAVEPRLRFNAWNGIRVEFHRASGIWRWRTTYRRPSTSAPRLATWLLDASSGSAIMRGAMSGVWRVPRPWWLETGTDDCA